MGLDQNFSERDHRRYVGQVRLPEMFEDRPNGVVKVWVSLDKIDDWRSINA